MGDLIEFLFQNPFLLIILIGIISSVLGKRKPKDRQAADASQPKKKWTEVMQEYQGQSRPEPKAERPKQPIRQAVQASAKQSEETKSEAEKRIAELRRLQQKYDRERVQHKEKAERIAGEIASEASPVYNTAPSFGKKELIDGIVMAEILGPTRAKRNLKNSRR